MVYFYNPSDFLCHYFKDLWQQLTAASVLCKLHPSSFQPLNYLIFLLSESEAYLIILFAVSRLKTEMLLLCSIGYEGQNFSKL